MKIATVHNKMSICHDKNPYLPSWKSRPIIKKSRSFLINSQLIVIKTNLNTKMAFHILIIFCLRAYKGLKRFSQLSYVVSLIFFLNIFNAERLSSELALKDKLNCSVSLLPLNPNERDLGLWKIIF